MKFGDLYIVELPSADGREQAGKRPAVVVHVNDMLPTVLIVPVTSKLKALNFPHTLRIEPTIENGLTVPSVLLVFQLRAIDKKRLLEQIGVLSSDEQTQLRHALHTMLGV